MNKVTNKIKVNCLSRVYIFSTVTHSICWRFQKQHSGAQYLWNTSNTLSNFFSSPSSFHVRVLYTSRASLLAWLSIMPIFVSLDLEADSVQANNHCSYSSKSFQFCAILPVKDSGSGDLQRFIMYALLTPCINQRG